MRSAILFCFSIMSILGCETYAQVDDLSLYRVSCSHRNNGINPARIALLQTGPDLFTAGTVINAGSIPYDMIGFDLVVTDALEVPVVLDTYTMDYLAEGDSVMFEWSTPWPVLPEGLYKATITVSAPDASDITPANNVAVIYFAIDNGIQSLDAIALYDPNLPTGNLGTNSFPESDEMMFLTGYEFIQPQVVHGMEILLSPGTQAGCNIYFFISDVDEGFFYFVDEYYYSNIHVVTAQDISNGYIRHYFPEQVTVPAGLHYAGLGSFLYGTYGHIRMRDDLSRVQHPMASMIHYEQQFWSNGNALAIRLLLQGSTTVADGTSSIPFASWPNPASDRLYFNLPLDASIDIQLIDHLGRIQLIPMLKASDEEGISSIDISPLAAGAYVLQINSEDGVRTTRFIKE